MELMENPLYEEETRHKIDFLGSQVQKSSSTMACKQMENSTYVVVEIPEPDYEDSERNYSCSLSSMTVVGSHFGHDYDSVSFNSDCEPPRNWTSRYVEIPEPDYDDTVSAPIPEPNYDTVRALLPSKCTFGNPSNSTINTPPPLIPIYKRCSSTDVSPDSPENHGIGTLLMRSLGTFCIMIWKVSAVCLLTVSIVRLCDNGLHYLWTTTEGYVIISLTIFLVLSFFTYILISSCKRNRSVNRTPVFL